MKQTRFVFLNCDAHEIMMIVISIDGGGFGFKCLCLQQLHQNLILSIYELMTVMMMVVMELLEVGLIDILARNNCIKRPTNASNW